MPIVFYVVAALWGPFWYAAGMLVGIRIGWEA